MKITSDEFELEISKAMNRLPKFLKEAVRESGVAVLAQDTSPDTPEDAVDGPLFAQFIGPTAVEFESGDSPYPPTVVLYRSTFESSCQNAEEMRDEIYLTLVHELGHFLGFDEDALEDV